MILGAAKAVLLKIKLARTKMEAKYITRAYCIREIERNDPYELIIICIL
ncbi:MAG: hypothetical protein WCE25_07250 [Nitrososphaeraceae archaeon]